ncbi:MAG: thioredoxin family protein [Flavobacterium sp.]|nr:MAG: thioredoxin family protein [Flavobacterium sp.]
MKTLRFKIFIILHFITAGYTLSYSQEKAQATDKKIKLYSFYFNGCGACKYMDQNILSNEAVKKYINANFEMQSVNGLVSPGNSLATQYHISVYPSFIFADSTGTALYRLEGASTTVAEFMKELNLAKNNTLKNQPKVADFAKTYQQKKYNLLFASGYTETLKAVGGREKTIDSVFSTWFTNVNKTVILKDTIALKFIMQNLGNLRTEQHEFFKANRILFGEKFEAREVEKNIATMIENSLDSYLAILDDGNMQDIRNHIMQMTAADEQTKRKIINNIEVTFYMSKKDYAKAVALMDEGLVFDFEQLQKCNNDDCRESIVQDVVLKVNNNMIAHINKEIPSSDALVLKKYLIKWSDRLKVLNNNQTNNAINHIDEAIKSRF